VARAHADDQAVGLLSAAAALSAARELVRTHGSQMHVAAAERPGIDYKKVLLTLSLAVGDCCSVQDLRSSAFDARRVHETTRRKYAPL